MGMKLPPREMVLYRRCDEVLHYLWDPIGVSGVPEARDEYDSYVPGVFSLLKADSTAEEIARYLSEIETSRMGLAANSARALEVSDLLRNWRSWIWENVVE